jgi:hypothetical protein
MRQSPAVIVHGLEMARAALAPGRPVTLLSAEGAAAYAGIGWWQALVRAAHEDFPETEVLDILDCGFAPGRALEALRAGHTHLVLRADHRVWADIAERTASLGGVLLAEAPAALDLAERGAQRRLEAWLAA